MDKTDLREDFFKDVRTDPYAHMITDLCANMWVEGYRQACINLRSPDEYHRQGYTKLRDKAIEWMTDFKQKRLAEAIIAFAEIGKKLDL